MEDQFFSPTDLAVRRICLGAMSFGREAAETTSRALLNHSSGEA